MPTMPSPPTPQNSGQADNPATLNPMTASYDEEQDRIVDALAETQSFESDEPFATYHEHRKAFEMFLHGPDGIPLKILGDPALTLFAVLKTLDYCMIETVEDSRVFLRGQFGMETDNIPHNSAWGMLSNLMVTKGYLDNEGDLGGSDLTPAGKVFRALLRNHLNEPTSEKIQNWEFEIDIDDALFDDTPHRCDP